MRKKKNKLRPMFILGLAVITVSTLCIACRIAGAYPPPPVFDSIEAAEEWLGKHGDGDEINIPSKLTMKMNLGDLSQENNNFLLLLAAIGRTQKYVNLDLEACTMGGTSVFTAYPAKEAGEGMDRVVSIRLPFAAKSVEADAQGRSPFYYFDNLKKIENRIYEEEPKGVIEIGDSAFSFQKTIERVSLSDAKSIGKEAFRGCEKLVSVGLWAVETIGDNAFSDCGSLKGFGFGYNPPVLGEEVFSGSTPSSLEFGRPKSRAGVYDTWLAANASKFKNNGNDVYFSGY